MPTVTLSTATINYERSGPGEGRPLVFVHGYTMGSSLWRSFAGRLAVRGFDCIAPTWPLGAHTEPMRDGADRTMEGMAALVAEFLDTLELDDVVLVGNDTGGAIAQIVATTTPARLGGLVLTSCDAFEHFPPKGFGPLIAAAKFAPTFRAMLASLRMKPVRRRGYGMLAHADIDHMVLEWIQPALRDARVAEDLRHFTASFHRETMVQAGARLPQFTHPALIAWSADDTFFPLEDARRLADALPDSRLEMIGGARTFSMIDQPDVLADLIADFAASPQRTVKAAEPNAG